MTKWSDIYGGGGTPSWEFGEERESTASVTGFADVKNIFDIAKVSETISMTNSKFEFDDFSDEDMTKRMYSSSSSLLLTENLTSPSSFLGLKANIVNIDKFNLSVTATGQNFSGHYDGVQTMLLSLPYQLRGGNGVGYSGGYAGHNWRAGGAYYSSYYGNGGGAIIIIADEIVGTGSLVARGGYKTNGTYSARGGGGMILIFVKKWDATVAIDVYGGQSGSYAIYKINSDNSKTLMVHSKNGASADLNGEAPVYGNNASVAW